MDEIETAAEAECRAQFLRESADTDVSTGSRQDELFNAVLAGIASRDGATILKAASLLSMLDQEAENAQRDIRGDLGWPEPLKAKTRCAQYGLPVGTPGLVELEKKLSQARNNYADARAVIASMGDVPESGPVQLSWSTLHQQAPRPTSHALEEMTGLRRRLMTEGVDPAVQERLLARDTDSVRSLVSELARRVPMGKPSEYEGITHEELTVLGALATDYSLNNRTHAPTQNLLHGLSREMAVRRFHRFAARRRLGQEAVELEPEPIKAAVSDRLPLCHRPADARAQARGLIRDADRFGVTNIAAQGICVSVAVHEATFADLVREDPDLELGVLRLRADDEVGSTVAADRPRPGLGRADHDLLLGVARGHAVVDGTEVEVRYLMDLGESTASTPEDLLAEAELHPHWPSWRSPESHLVEDAWSSMSVRSTPPGADQPRYWRRPLELLGPDECDHPGGSWRPIRGAEGDCPDTFGLSCETCLRRRIAVEPVHRFPERSIAGLLDFDEAAYLRQERVHAFLRHDDRPFEGLDELRARDGVIDPSPARYASTPAPDSTPQSPRSVSAIMMSRRR
ncbi:hypothetical protein [Miltoncostaea oceani]|uniref:hypothetical protein n=1 Tax=Miltoncostaea oceani TaxID=2843216 RepID=UPI001C3DD01F|nr:hypothetical protein [Miltoncostaea oceani]